MQLSIRATGLLSILQTNPNLALDIDMLYQQCDESTQYIDHTIKELVSAGAVTLSGRKITLLAPQNELVPLDKSLESRIYRLFSNNRTYSVISWFLAQLDKTFDLDVELRERVLAEYEAANIVQFWSDYNIEQAMRRALVDKSIGTVTLEDLRELLSKKDRGEIVWQK